LATYLSGKFTPKHLEKYSGDATQIQYRSSWEKKAMIWFDTNPSILQWASEEIVIPYISPLDNRPHRYFPDFAVKYKTKDGTIKKALVEVKPFAQCNPPKQQKRMSKRLITETTTYLVNQAKWNAAKEWCDKNQFDFIVLTERELCNG